MNTSIAKFVKILPFVIGALSVSFVHAQQVTATSSDVKWINAPASLPAGARLVMLKGDLAKQGTFAFRLKLPAGYRLNPHSNPAIGRILVMSGTFNLGAGENFDSARTIPLSAGYMHWPDKSPYFAFTTEETVLEIEGVGPWAVNYVNADDDPMKKKHVSRSTVR
jgi:hypothetical protein